MNHRTHNSLALAASLALIASLAPASPVEPIRDARITGGLVAQVGSDSLELKELGTGFQVRLLLPDAASVAKTQAAIDAAGLPGRFTAAEWSGGALPFADRVLNALVLAKEGAIENSEAERVLAPGGLLIGPSGAKTMAGSPTTDGWTHYLYDASGNAVSRDREVGPPVSFRWHAPPRHLRSHNHASSFTGLIAERGRTFHFQDEGTWLFDKDQGGIGDRWSLVARDAFNGALLWRRPLEGYGQGWFEDVSGQASPEYVWRTPLSMNRRLVAQGGRVFAALNYRQGPLGVLDAASGELLHEIDTGGIVDELVAAGDLVVCRVRAAIPKPIYSLDERKKLAQQWKKEGMPDEQAKREIDRRISTGLMEQTGERIVAVDAAKGSVAWTFDAGRVAVQSLAMAGGKVLFHNYEAILALDAKTGQPAWQFASPVKMKNYWTRNLLGNLLVADGKVLWTSGDTGGAVCLDLADGKELWKNPGMGATGGFAFPTARRVVKSVIYSDGLIPQQTLKLADGKPAQLPDLGDMLKRGHHIRCFPGKATERYIITPMRGAEFIDLEGSGHSVNDWLRGACSLGNLPANGLLYVTPDPCSCYSGARIYGFTALAPKLPDGMAGAPAPQDATRLEKGPAHPAVAAGNFAANAGNADGAAAWPTYRHDARRTSMAGGGFGAALKPAWTRDLGGALTQATVWGDRAFVVNRDTCQLLCLDMADGKTAWARSFPAALDGPPTLVRGNAAQPEIFCYLGCRDGSIWCLRASDGAVAWRFRAAPLERLTLDDGRLENVWPVSSSVLFHNGLIYAVAGRNSYLDGGVHLFALDPATGEVRHHRNLEGPRPGLDELKEGVLDPDLRTPEKDPVKRKEREERMAKQYATGYNLRGAEADLLGTDGRDLYMMQTKLDAALEPVPLDRIYYTGLTPMGGMHLIANVGFLDDSMYHRAYWMFDESWPGYGGGSGWAARAGTMLAVGAERAYSAKHYEQGWYPTHAPGSGNRLVADTFEHKNTSGALADKTINTKFSQFGNPPEIVRTGAPVWKADLPIIVRAMLVAPDGKGSELVFSAGIVEGKTPAQWEKSTNYEGPGKLLVHAGGDGTLLAEYDLPACPVFDGMSAAGGRLPVSLVNGQIACFAAKSARQP